MRYEIYIYMKLIVLRQSDMTPLTSRYFSEIVVELKGETVCHSQWEQNGERVNVKAEMICHCEAHSHSHCQCEGEMI